VSIARRSPSYTYTQAGTYEAVLVVSSDVPGGGTLTDRCTIQVSVGNAAPAITINAPAFDGGMYCSGSVSYLQLGAARLPAVTPLHADVARWLYLHRLTSAQH
jgi:PKD repeat protein